MGCTTSSTVANSASADAESKRNKPVIKKECIENQLPAVEKRFRTTEDPNIYLDEPYHHENSSKGVSRVPVLTKKDLVSDLSIFANIDKHAQKAPTQLRSSLRDLVGYLCKPSKDPLLQVRAFFVWIAKNIRYDVDGFFGKAAKSSCDSDTVMKTGLSVCEGYARVFEAMCKEAGIEVKKISGYSKGYGYSPEHPVTTRHQTDHAWNAVYLKGNWSLLDCTWGAGHVDRNKRYQVRFTEFYFLTDPNKFAYSHFPYMDDNMEESMKWQLLKTPLSLEKFNSLLDIKPDAFEFGLLPQSHKQSIVQFDDETELTFNQKNIEDNVFSATLFKEEGNMLREQQFSTYIYTTKGLLRIKIKPPVPGKYQLKIYGRKQSNEPTESLPEMFEYVLECSVPTGKTDMRHFPFPKPYPQAFTDKCEVLEPLGVQIPPNTDIKMSFKSPILKRMMVSSTMLRKNGDVFEGSIKTPDRNYLIEVFGSQAESGSLAGQHQFCVG